MALNNGDWWTSGNGNVYRYDGNGVKLVGKNTPELVSQMGSSASLGLGLGGSKVGKQISDPFHGQGNSAAAEAEPAAAVASGDGRAVANMANLRGNIRGYQGDVDSIYNQLFADLDALVRSRSNEIDVTAGDNVNKLTDQYIGSIPGIESSYAALGSGDSTDNTYAKVDAKKGYEDSVSEVGKQKQKDLTELSAYDQDTRAGWQGERDALSRIFSRLDQAQNENELYDMRNKVETQLDGARATRSKLKTDDTLKKDIAARTDSSSRMGSIQDSLNSILNSSLASGVKEAAQAAVGQSAGLTDEEKNQIKQNNPYQTN